MYYVYWGYRCYFVINFRSNISYIIPSIADISNCLSTILLFPRKVDALQNEHHYNEQVNNQTVCSCLFRFCKVGRF